MPTLTDTFQIPLSTPFKLQPSLTCLRELLPLHHSLSCVCHTPSKYHRPLSALSPSSLPVFTLLTYPSIRHPFLPSSLLPYSSLSILNSVFIFERTKPRVKQVERKGRYAAPNATPKATAPLLQPAAAIRPSLIEWIPSPASGFIQLMHNPSQPSTRSAPISTYDARLASLTQELTAI